MTAEVITSFEERRKRKELAGVRDRFQAVADRGGPLAEIAARWVHMLAVVDREAMQAIQCLERAAAE